MTLRVLQIDAFADRAFTGNPAAVCLLERELPEALMARIAMEMNLSETAFVRREGDGFRLRWFTPVVEVALCGHATLATAHALWREGWLAPGEPARFFTLHGELSARQQGDGIELDFPACPAALGPVPAGLGEALGVEPLLAGTYDDDLLVLVDSEATVRELQPDLARLCAATSRGVCVTAPSADPSFDFVSRFFAPAVGIDEDPVTGSAHTALAPFWAERLGKTRLRAFQASARGGALELRLEGDRVRITGRAVTVLVGELVGMGDDGV